MQWLTRTSAVVFQILPGIWRWLEEEGKTCRIHWMLVVVLRRTVGAGPTAWTGKDRATNWSRTDSLALAQAERYLEDVLDLQEIPVTPKPYISSDCSHPQTSFSCFCCCCFGTAKQKDQRCFLCFLQAPLPQIHYQLSSSFLSLPTPTSFLDKCLVLYFFLPWVCLNPMCAIKGFVSCLMNSSSPMGRFWMWKRKEWG